MTSHQHSGLVRADNQFECWSFLKKAMVFVVCLVAVVSLYGCAINRASASVSPDVEFTQLMKFYVVRFGPDNRGTNRLITNQLNIMGYEATTGPEDKAPNCVDVVVTYQDKWRWDIKMYMLELDITFRNPKTNSLLAVGNSYHTSLSRKSPGRMVREVLNNIFEKSKKGKE